MVLMNCSSDSSQTSIFSLLTAGSDSSFSSLPRSPILDSSSSIIRYIRLVDTLVASELSVTFSRRVQVGSAAISITASWIIWCTSPWPWVECVSTGVAGSVYIILSMLCTMCFTCGPGNCINRELLKVFGNCNNFASGY